MFYIIYVRFNLLIYKRNSGLQICICKYFDCFNTIKRYHYESLFKSNKNSYKCNALIVGCSISWLICKSPFMLIYFHAYVACFYVYVKGRCSNVSTFKKGIAEITCYTFLFLRIFHRWYKHHIALQIYCPIINHP